MAFSYSDRSNEYLRRLQEIEANKPGEYQSKYGTQIGDLLDKITNRQPFSYDFNADPLYQQYKDQYTKLGNEAAMNAVGAASSLTGGYGNSYATTAGAQANQQYLTQLNGIIPELYNAAMSKYQMEGEDLMNKYGLYRDADDVDYGRYRDAYGDWQNERNYYNDQFNNERNWDFTQYQYANRKTGSGSGGSKKSEEDTKASREGLSGQIESSFTADLLQHKKNGQIDTDYAKKKIKMLYEAGRISEANALYLLDYWNIQ